MAAKNAFVFLLLAAVAPAGCGRPPPQPDVASAYERPFHDAIASSDGILVRDDGFVSPRPPDERGVLFQITEAAEVRELKEHLAFQEVQTGQSCACPGYPGIDWYCGQELLVATSVQHGKAIRWKGFPGDAQLTEESAAWLRQWLARHGLPERALQ